MKFLVIVLSFVLIFSALTVTIFADSSEVVTETSEVSTSGDMTPVQIAITSAIMFTVISVIGVMFAKVVIKNSKIACKLDVYNDATSNYQWYNYRTCGMVVADVRDNHTVNDRTEANPVTRCLQRLRKASNSR